MSCNRKFRGWRGLCCVLFFHLLFYSHRALQGDFKMTAAALPGVHARSDTIQRQKWASWPIFFKSVQIFCRFFLADFSSLISLNYVKNPCLNQLLGKGMTHEDLTQIQIYGQHILKCMGILRGGKNWTKLVVFGNNCVVGCG